MKTNTILALVALSTVAAAVTGCSADTTPVAGADADSVATASSALLAAAGGSGDVGQGADTTSQSIKPMYCIQPAAGTKWPEVGYPSSTVSMTLQSDRTQIARSLGIDVSASYGIASAAASFFRSTESDDLSVSYVFGGTMNFKDVQVGPNFQVHPNLKDKGIVDWYDYCGDSYIQKVSRGATLYTAMKFHFASSTDKQSFETSFKVAGFVTASAALKMAQTVSKQSTSVDVTAVQVGGDVTQLSRALSGADAASCAMGSPSSCLGYLNSIETYASATFPKQFLDAQGRPLTGDALDRVTGTTGYVTQPWTSLAIPNVPNLSGKPEAKELLSLFEAQFTTQSTMDAINGVPVLARRGTAMAQKQKAALDADSITVAQNVRSIQNAWDVCFPDAGAGCADALANAKASLVPIDAEHLVPWFDALYPGNYAADPVDFVDVRNDGHTDLCYLTNSTMVECLMGVGGGFAEKPGRRIDHGDASIPYRPWAWMKLRGNGQNGDLAVCAPTQLDKSVLDCIPIVDGAPKGLLRLTRDGAGSVGIVAPRGDTDPSGIDGKTIFSKSAKIINDRSGNMWPGGK